MGERAAGDVTWSGGLWAHVACLKRRRWAWTLALETSTQNPLEKPGSTYRFAGMMRHLPLLASLWGALSSAIPTADTLPLSKPILSERISPSTRQTAAPSYWTPPMKSRIQFILTGIPDVDDGYIKPNSGVYEIDMFWTPAETIKTMNQLGQKTICYFSAATAENWRDDYGEFQRQDLGKELPDWPGERYLDIRRENVFKVIQKRIDLAAEKGCNAIEPDNVGVFPSLPLSPLFCSSVSLGGIG